MKKKDEEIGLAEIAVLSGVHRQTAYWAARSGEISGARLLSGKFWVACRSEVKKWSAKRRREEEPGEFSDK